MKKVALSLLVIAASGAYVWSQSGGQATGELLGAAPGGDIQTGSIPRPVPAATGPSPDGIPQPAPLAPQVRATPDPAPANSGAPERQPADKLTEAVPPPAPVPATPAAEVAEPGPLPDPRIAQVPASVPLPRPRPAYRETPATQLVTRAAMAIPASASYADGTYTGPVVDAYYGLIQIQAVIRSGHLAGVNVLQYPADRRTSVAINRQALPMLRDEVVSAQSARVDIISGATLTSEAFIRSLDGALRQAGS